MPEVRRTEIVETYGSKGYSKKVVMALGLILVAFAILAITFIALYAVEVGKEPASLPEPPPAVEVCSTQGCRDAADRLSKSMDTSIEPCDNFYEFACGRWNQTYTMPEEKGRWGVFDVLRVELSSRLRSLLNVSDASPIEGLNATQKVQRYFQACMDEDKIDDDADNLRRLSSHMAEIFPEYIQLQSSNGTDIPELNETIRAVGRARKYGIRMIFNNFVQSDNAKPRTSIIHFDSASLGMDQSFYLKNTTEKPELDAYRKYLTDLINLFTRKAGAEPHAPTVDDTVQKFINFETELAKVKLTPSERRNVTLTDNKMTLGQFAANYTSRIGVNVSDLIQYFVDAWENPEVTARLNEDSIVNVRETRYYERLTSPELWTELNTAFKDIKLFPAVYVGFQIASSYIDRMGSDFRNISQTFSNTLRGINANVPRWETCANRVNNEFPNAVGRLYSMAYFSASAKERLNKMVRYLFYAIREIIINADWMTEQTQKRALEKAYSFVVLAGYEDYIVDDPARLNEEHLEFDVSSNSFLQMGFSLRRLATKNEAIEWVNGTKKDTWITGAAVVNAFFAPNFASISFPAGILQPPFLGEDYPDYWNYGAVGTVIGHEITHGFDDKGSNYNGDGVLDYWWDEASRRKFDERAQSLIDQYSSYSLMGIQMNGELTQGENIADNGGMKESFRGYQRYRQQEHAGKPEPRLPGLEQYSPEQVFFLANAQVWCSDFRQKELENQVRTGAHSPGRFRVIGPMQNYDEFANAYGCSENSFMNPAKKNGVW